MILNYLGSKARFAPTLHRVIEPVLRKAAEKTPSKRVVFGDLFAGTGFVGNFYKDNGLVSSVVSCDLELYSCVLSKALLETVYTPSLSRLITYLNGDDLVPIKGLIYKHFSPAGGRMFFTEENAMRIDAMRISIQTLYDSQKISYKEMIFLLASLMAACSRTANCASCFRAYLKTFCPRSLKLFKIVPVHTNTSRVSKTHKVYKNDACNVAQKEPIDVAYLDPPYNANHYGGYYSFYNYLLIYRDDYEIGGIAGVTKEYNKSAFGLKMQARCALRTLIERLYCNDCKYVVMSYNSDAVMKENDIIEVLKIFGSVQIFKTTNKKYKPNERVKELYVTEYMYVLDFNGNKGDAEHMVAT